jgi:hypothetical protein
MFALLVILSVAQVDAASQKDYAELLAKHVKNGRVDYKTIGDKDLVRLDRYVKAIGLAAIPTEREAAMAMMIDAYNAFVIRSVITRGRPRSVLDSKDFFSAVEWSFAGKIVSLDELEKKRLNPIAKDPRTHFVLVCGAVGCPILEDKPYAGTPLETRLDVATRRYLSSPAGAVVESGAVKLSKIFDWYAPDFGGEAGALAFVKKHLPPESLEKLGASPKIAYLDYNWTLNQQ